MVHIAESNGTARQQAAIDDFLERAAEVIAAQPKPGRSLLEAKAVLSRKVREVTIAAQDHMARRARTAGRKSQVLPAGCPHPNRLPAGEGTSRLSSA